MYYCSTSVHVNKYNNNVYTPVPWLLADMAII